MKTKQGLTLRVIGNEHVLVPEGLEAVDFNKMVSMNATAAFLWEVVEGKDFYADTLAQLLVDEYGIDNETAQKDVMPLLQTWKEASIITD